ncbi:PaaX family transcriptional regulator C-terminal domain-containing protein [Pediococcus argentinicus]|uniref:Uncharacterized protein n=1 Tax=Pediococcus argentinicus TaxID=480391 RepID=A0A0R2NCM0_9LACO|nr:PaaX family transcriptional regulator C-terminal domain-containing protein [Pediococcus argentinicus]KRO23068.1 hypothetical protein IV88_GL001044 [Pediococcus argentinicus]NKZ22948.1 hypothetical protein [Pediococcus argentinicus]GEP20019.1 hypothetical protein LSA03_14030 [Pediococcus argentinicus]
MQLTELKRNGLIKNPQRGIYEMTKDGVTDIDSLEEKVVEINSINFTYTLVTTSFSGNGSFLRQQIRAHLLRLGFGAMENGTYLAIGNRTEQLQLLLQDHPDLIRVFNVTEINPTLNRDSVNDIWGLDSISTKLSEMDKNFETNFKQTNLSQLTNLELLHQYLTLIDQVSEYYTTDPMLPKQLIGSDWIGYKLLRSYIQYGINIIKSVNQDEELSQFFDYQVITNNQK